MKTISYKSSGFRKELENLFTRQVCPDGIEESVRKIVQDVRLNGDKAVSKYLLKFDSASIKPNRFLVSDCEIRKANGEVSTSTKKAIDLQSGMSRHSQKNASRKTGIFLRASESSWVKNFPR
jgi:histidinol dehydrogenase